MSQYAIVPLEPTPKMIDLEVMCSLIPNNLVVVESRMTAIYKYMLSSAPNPWVDIDQEQPEKHEYVLVWDPRLNRAMELMYWGVYPRLIWWGLPLIKYQYWMRLPKGPTSTVVLPTKLDKS